jgi:hypothetical protein
MDIRQLDPREKSALIISFILYLLIVMFLSASSDTQIWKVAIGTSPIILHWIVFFFFVVPRNVKAWMFWGLPILFPAAFFIIWSSGSLPIISQMDGAMLTAMNIFIIYIINVPILFFFVRKIKTKIIIKEEPRQENDLEKDHYKQLAENYFHENQQYADQVQTLSKDAQDKELYKQMAHDYSTRNKQYLEQITTLQAKMQKISITQENFSLTLRSIEDKCKGINFVVGRVYSNKKGGSPNLRQKLTVNRDLYNSFSELTATAEMDKEKADKLLIILLKIQRQLEILERPEWEIITLQRNPLIALKRDSEGKDIILEVLEKNDKDPIVDYYAEAKEVCIKLIEYLKRTYE